MAQTFGRKQFTPTTAAMLRPDFKAKQSLRKKLKHLLLYFLFSCEGKLCSQFSCIPSCIRTMYRSEESSCENSRDGSMPMYLGGSITENVYMKKGHGQNMGGLNYPMCRCATPLCGYLPFSTGSTHYMLTKGTRLCRHSVEIETELSPASPA